MGNPSAITNDELKAKLKEDLAFYADLQRIALPRKERILKWYAECGNPEDGDYIVNLASANNQLLAVPRDRDANDKANEIVDSFIVMRQAMTMQDAKLDSEEFYTQTREMIRKRIRNEANGQRYGMASQFREVIVVAGGALCVFVAGIALQLGLDRLATAAIAMAADLAV
jgi:hypothetical protein